MWEVSDKREWRAEGQETRRSERRVREVAGQEQDGRAAASAVGEKRAEVDRRLASAGMWPHGEERRRGKECKARVAEAKTRHHWPSSSPHKLTKSS
mmetsp:Transcript_60444/g.128119  ORF Transcript_60444/g.128119 Transcript_60444/m.128119 type:complete len:96 (+) Transcript_60444:112-399(+)